MLQHVHRKSKWVILQSFSTLKTLKEHSREVAGCEKRMFHTYVRHE